MKKLFGILGTLAGAGLTGFGIYSLIKGKNDVEVDGSDYYDSDEDEVDDEDESEDQASKVGEMSNSAT